MSLFSKGVISLFLTFASFTAVAIGPAGAGPRYALTPKALINDVGCTANSLDANDDGSTDLVDLPFTVNFFGNSYSSLYINNNGNVTFNDSLSVYTPFDITASTPPMIAPFFADVDTRGTGTVTYGTTTFNGFPTFCVNWNAVGYYDQQSDRTNTFQLLLVSRPDIGNGSFDIIFNYDQIQWETGDASDGSDGKGGTSAVVGFSNGDGSNYFELPGSATPGTFTDDGSSPLIQGFAGGTTPGRYVFPVRPNDGATIDLSGLDRQFPSAFGFSFKNPHFQDTLQQTGLLQRDILNPNTLSAVFADWPRYAYESQPLENRMASVMQGGMCFGMALAGTRFDAGATALSSVFPSSWGQLSAAADLPAPNLLLQPPYNQDLLTLLSENFTSQISVEVLSSEARQQDAFSDPRLVGGVSDQYRVTAGFLAFEEQLADVMKLGVDHYDHSGLIAGPPGTGMALIGIREGGGDGYGSIAHEIAAYSAAVESDGSIKLGVWDNEDPNHHHTIEVHPDGTWRYDAPPQIYTQNYPFRSLASMESGARVPNAYLSILPLYRPTNLHFNPAPLGLAGAAGELGSGALVDLPPGSDAHVTDAGSYPVTEISLAAGVGTEPSSVDILPSGSGTVLLPSGGVVDIRGSDAVLAATSDAPSGLQLAVDTSQNAISLDNGSGTLSVTTHDHAFTATGATALQVAPDGGLTIGGTADSTTSVTATGIVNGSQVTTAVFQGVLGAGATTSVSASSVNAALRAAAPPPPPQPVYLHLAATHLALHHGRSDVLRVNVRGHPSVVQIQMVVKGRWRPVANARLRGGVLSIPVKNTRRGTVNYRAVSFGTASWRAASSNIVRIRWL
jgi:Nidogen-like